MFPLSRLDADLSPTVRHYVKGLGRHLGDANMLIWAQAIAFKVLVTLVPAVILCTGIIGQVLQRPTPFSWVEQFIRDYLPGYRSNDIITFLNSLQEASGTLTWIGAISLIFWTMTLYTTLRVILLNVFVGEQKYQRRPFWKGYAFDLRMVFQTALFFVTSLGLTFALQALDAFGLDAMQEGALAPAWLQSGWHSTFQAFGYVLTVLLSTGMFLQLYYFTPTPHPPFRSALWGAGVAALLWEAAKYAFTFYATHVSTFDRYGTPDDGLALLGDTFGLIVALVFWAYYSGAIFILGAVISILHEHASTAVEA